MYCTKCGRLITDAGKGCLYCQGADMESAKKSGQHNPYGENPYGSSQSHDKGCENAPDREKATVSDRRPASLANSVSRSKDGMTKGVVEYAKKADARTIESVPVNRGPSAERRKGRIKRVNDDYWAQGKNHEEDSYNSRTSVKTTAGTLDYRDDRQTGYAYQSDYDRDWKEQRKNVWRNMGKMLLFLFLLLVPWGTGLSLLLGIFSLLPGKKDMVGYGRKLLSFVSVILLLDVLVPYHFLVYPYYYGFETTLLAKIMTILENIGLMFSGIV